MPGYKGHLAGGLVIFGLTLYVLSWYCVPTLLTVSEWLLFALAGSLFPDVDVKSKGQNYFYWIIFCLLILLLYAQKWKIFALASVLAMIPLLVRHRGIFHRAWFMILMPTSVVFFISSYIPHHHSRLMFDLLFFVMGALSHLWLDLGLKRMFRW